MEITDCKNQITEKRNEKRKEKKRRVRKKLLDESQPHSSTAPPFFLLSA